MLAGCSLPFGGRSTPIAARDIDLNGDCRRTEEDGFREDAQLRVADNAVQQFAVEAVGRQARLVQLQSGRLPSGAQKATYRVARQRWQRLQADGLAGPAPRDTGARELPIALHARHL